MRYTLVNSILASFEYILLHEKRDQFLDFGFLTTEIKKRLVLFGDDLSKVDEHIYLLGQMIKSEEFRSLIRSGEFQQIYMKSLSLPPYFLGGAEKLCSAGFWSFLDKSKAYEDFSNSQSVRQFKSQLDKFKRDEFLLLANIYIKDLSKIFMGFIRIDLIPNEIELLPLSKSKKKNTASIMAYNKEFEFCAAQITEKSVKALLEKYLVESDNKKAFIKDSIGFLQATKKILFTWQDEEPRNFSLNFITLYILELECNILNNYVYQKSQNTTLYQMLMVENPLFKLDHVLLFNTLVPVLFRGSILPHQDDFNDFWHEYVNSLNEKHKQHNENERHKKLQEALKKVEEIIGTKPSKSNPVREKKKLSCYNYLFAALLHEKARHTGDDFVRLCRESADTYIDRNGKEFTGEQLANVFHITVKKYGGWPGFYENNKEKIKKLKKEINWQE